MRRAFSRSPPDSRLMTLLNRVGDPHDTEWNSRAFEVSDPSGFLLTIFSETSA